MLPTVSHVGMAATKLTDSDANLYRLYAVGLLGYEDALGQAQSVFHLRRAMLEFDQNARTRNASSGEGAAGDETNGLTPASTDSRGAHSARNER